MQKSPGMEKRLTRCKERVRQLQTCYQVTSLLNSELNLSLLLDTIMSIAKQVVRADASSLLLMNEEKSHLTFQVALGTVGEQIKTLRRLKVGEGIAGAVAQTGKSMIIKDAYKNARFNPQFDKETGFKTGSILCSPLIFKGEVLGVCQIIHHRDKKKVFSGSDLALFTLFCDSAALAIQNARMHEMHMEKQRMEKDMEFAKSVQESFFQTAFPVHDHFIFAAKTVPALVVGGDFYDFIPFNEDLLGIVLGDVSGKGVSAALHMARLLSDFRYISQVNPEPAAVLSKVNDILCTRTHRGMFATATYLLIDLQNKILKAANSGHHPLLLKNNDGKVAERVKAGGVPLGILPNVKYPQEEIPLKQGDRVFLYTDGVIEPTNAKDEPFGLDRLTNFLSQSNEAPEIMLTHLEQTIKNFTGNVPKFDDMTFLTFQLM